MLRLVSAGLACICCYLQMFMTVPAHADDNAAGPMRFEWRREGPAQMCGAACRIWISATGYVTSDTPREFEAFARRFRRRGRRAGARFRRRLGARHAGARPRHPQFRHGHDRGSHAHPAAGHGRRALRRPRAELPLRVDVRVPAAGGLAALRAAAGAGAGAPDLARQEAQDRAGVRAIRPKSSTSCSATSGGLRITPSKWAATSSCSSERCKCRHGSRCIACRRPRSIACGSAPSKACSSKRHSVRRQP